MARDQPVHVRALSDAIALERNETFQLKLQLRSSISLPSNVFIQDIATVTIIDITGKMEYVYALVLVCHASGSLN